MWACLDRLNEGLEMLRHYLDGLDKEDHLIALTDAVEGNAGQVLKDFQDHFRKQHNKSKFDYNTIIVSLYGYLERYIEDLITEYLDEVASHSPTYTDLPEDIRNNHLAFSIDLSRKIDQQRYSGNLRVEEVIARLHTCFTAPERYQLNVQAFTQHSSNFRHSMVVQTLSQCGISEVTQSIKQADPFISFLRDEDSERDVTTFLSKEDKIVFYRLNDLANRRNDVAHGTPVDDVLSNDYLRTYVNFVGAYAVGLALVVYEQLLPFMVKQATSLGRPIAVHNSHIVCVKILDGIVSVGDTLIAKTQDSSRPYKAGPILGIEKDRVPLNTVNGGPDVKIGMRVGFVAKENQEFYFLKSTTA